MSELRYLPLYGTVEKGVISLSPAPAHQRALERPTTTTKPTSTKQKDHKMSKTEAAIAKAVQKSVRRSLDQQAAARAASSAIGAVVKAAEAPRLRRIAELARQMRGANDQERIGLGYELARAQLALGHQRETVAKLGLTPQSQQDSADAIALASAPAMARATGAPVLPRPPAARDQLADIFAGDYVRQAPSRSATELPSQVRLHQQDSAYRPDEVQEQIESLRKQLHDAMVGKDMQRASNLSWQLTKAELRQMHESGDQHTVVR